MAVPKGTKVRQIVPVIEGTVTGYSIDQESGEALILVSWDNGKGVAGSKYFKESEVEVVPEVAPKE